MLKELPTNAQEVMDWEWEQYSPYYEALLARELNGESVAGWLADWTQLHNLLSEVIRRRYLAHAQDTTDGQAEQRFHEFLEQIWSPAQQAEKSLKDKLLRSGLKPQGMAVPLRRLQAEADLFREENVSLEVELGKLGTQYEKIAGNQTVMWQGEERPLPQLQPWLHDPDRKVREQVWRLAQERRLADRQALNALWQEMIALRRQVATNAGHPDFRSYKWQAYQRFHYSPADAETFREAIAEVCVPAASRIYERHRQRLGLETIRPWDISDGEWRQPVDPPGSAQLKPYTSPAELLAKSANVFRQVDGQLGSYFQRLIDKDLLDVENRVGKAPGAYCTWFSTAKQPFIFMNGVGLAEDVRTLLHESGHAFHCFAQAHLPYHPQGSVPMEFAEVASMAMELLAGQYLAIGNGSAFYTPAEAARANREHLERFILFWPYMAVVDGFQDWAYTQPDEATDPAICDAKWLALWQRFLPGPDWNGLEDMAATGWHRKVHIFTSPFYYIEYGLAQLGAVQIWRNAQDDQAMAVKRYRQALALGGTATLPDLFATAGAQFAFDTGIVRQVVDFLEKKVEELEEVV